MAKKKNKRFFLSVVEECIMNPKYDGYRGGRIEVYDEKEKSEYAIGEGRFFLPSDLALKFREIFDFIDIDKKCMVKFDMFEMVEEAEKRRKK